MLEDQLDKDLKEALLSRDELKVRTLRSLKSAILNQKIASRKRDSGLSDDETITVLKKQSKQCQESADAFTSGGNQAKADDEIGEKAIIDSYLPAAMPEADLIRLIDAEIAAQPEKSAAALGPVIATVRTKAGPAADGSLIARLVKERLIQ